MSYPERAANVTTKAVHRIGIMGMLLALGMLLSGCFLTKLVSVPLRVGGAVVSVVPGIGNTAHDAIDEVADTVDDMPL